MSKYLIINADDFGYNPEQTKAIDELMRAGLITSTSLTAVAPDAENAVEMAKKGGYSVGIHLTINSDNEQHRWQSVSGAASLTDGEGLYHSSFELGRHAKRRDVRAELEAQYDFIVSRGCRVDHADNHCGTLYGLNGRRFFLDAYDFCAAHNLPYRFPKTTGFISRQIGREAPGAVAALQKAIVNCGVRRGVAQLDDLVSNPWSMERIKDYDTLRDYYIKAVENCIDGVTEMFLHPSYPVEGESNEWTKRVYEFELLKSGDLLEAAEKNSVKLIPWSAMETADK